MVYEYLEHEADVGIKGIGKTVEEAFSEGARAMFDVMVDINQINTEKSIDIEVSSNSIENLFVEFLNELLYKRDVEEMFFSKFEISIDTENFILKGKAFGDKINLNKHEVKTEVKAASYYGLKYEKKDNHSIQCVLDV